MPNEFGKFHTYISHEAGGLLRSKDVGNQLGESASLCESLAEVKIVPPPERIPMEERNDEELLIDPDSEEEAELDSDDEVF